MTLVPVSFPEMSRLQEIARVLLEARNAPDYNIGSPRAIDHLLTHVVAALEDIDMRLKAMEA
jgi:hypothetical protein